MLKQGRILKGIGGFYYVDIGNELITCRARGKFRKSGEKPYVGDICDIDILPDNTGYLLSISERKNLMLRPPISNIDTIAVVASAAPPATDTYFIDRISAVAALEKIEMCLVINKCDIDSACKLREAYKNTSIKLFFVSAKTGEGVEALKEFFSGKLVALTGNSGVGKSTLINAIMPSACLETGSLNEKIGRGRHTTRLVEILKINENTWIADTPGFSAFDVTDKGDFSCETLHELFPEFSDYTPNCRYVGCSHTKEAGCAVVEAVQNGCISESRFKNYTRLYEELNAIPKYKQ